MSELIYLGSPETAPVSSTDAELVAQIPSGMPVKLEYDVAAGQYRYAALTPAELAQRDVDQKAAAAEEAAAAQAQADRDALVAKLVAGTATDVEVQQAVAEVLGP